MTDHIVTGHNGNLRATSDGTIVDPLVVQVTTTSINSPGFPPSELDIEIYYFAESGAQADFNGGARLSTISKTFVGSFGNPLEVISQEIDEPSGTYQTTFIYGPNEHTFNVPGTALYYGYEISKAEGHRTANNSEESTNTGSDQLRASGRGTITRSPTPAPAPPSTEFPLIWKHGGGRVPNDEPIIEMNGAYSSVLHDYYIVTYLTETGTTSDTIIDFEGEHLLFQSGRSTLGSGVIFYVENVWYKKEFNLSDNDVLEQEQTQNAEVFGRVRSGPSSGDEGGREDLTIIGGQDLPVGGRGFQVFAGPLASEYGDAPTPSNIPIDTSQSAIWAFVGVGKFATSTVSSVQIISVNGRTFKASDGELKHVRRESQGQTVYYMKQSTKPRGDNYTPMELRNYIAQGAPIQTLEQYPVYQTSQGGGSNLELAAGSLTFFNSDNVGADADEDAAQIIATTLSSDPDTEALNSTETSRPYIYALAYTTAAQGVGRPLNHVRFYLVPSSPDALAATDISSFPGVQVRKDVTPATLVGGGLRSWANNNAGQPSPRNFGPLDPGEYVLQAWGYFTSDPNGERQATTTPTRVVVVPPYEATDDDVETTGSSPAPSDPSIAWVLRATFTDGVSG